MNSKWRRFAPFGLYLALAAALVAAGLFIVQREWNLPLQISLGLIVIGLALFVALNPQRVREMLTGRQARYGSNALILSVAFLGILITINYLVYENTQRWDLTEDRQYTLAPETINTLAELPGEAEATAFFSTGSPTEQVETMLDQYQFHSDGKFSYEFVDPILNPVAAQEAKITRDGSVVVSMNGNQQIVESVNERELTAALVRLISPEERTVYFLTGHGEFDPTAAGEEGYSVASRVLESKNYNVQSLSLLSTNAIPEDAKVVIVAGARQPLQESEVDLLKAYLDGGGALVVLQEPTLLTDQPEAEDPLAGLLEEWGVVLGNDMVVDTSSQQATLFAVGIDYGAHAIVSDLAGLYTILPTARSVTVVPAANGASQQVLVSTGQQAWAETDLAAFQQQNPQVMPDEDADILGPVPLAVAAENFETNGRLVVVGDGDFATDANFTAYANGDLLVNAVDWSAGQEALIDLTPKEQTQRLMIPPSRVTMNLILLGTVFIIPGLALFLGILAFIQQRRRG